MRREEAFRVKKGHCEARLVLEQRDEFDDGPVTAMLTLKFGRKKYRYALYAISKGFDDPAYLEGEHVDFMFPHERDEKSGGSHDS